MDAAILKVSKLFAHSLVRTSEQELGYFLLIFTLGLDVLSEYELLFHFIVMLSEWISEKCIQNYWFNFVLSGDVKFY